MSGAGVLKKSFKLLNQWRNHGDELTPDPLPFILKK